MAKTFDLVEYIKRNLINGYKDGTWTESKVSQLALGYMSKGYITLEDVAEIDAEIQTIKAEMEAEANAISEESEETEVQTQQEDSDDGGVESV